MKGEVDHRPYMGRNPQDANGGMGRIGSMKKSTDTQGERAGNRGNVIHSTGNSLSRGDYGKGMNPNYTGMSPKKKSQGDFLKSKGGRW